MRNIKNFIFDLGGVVYDTETDNVIKALKSHGVTNIDLFTNPAFNLEMDNFELGNTSAAWFRNWVRSALNLDISDREFDDIFNSMLVDIPSERVALLLALKQRYRVLLFSNTNEIHCKAFTQRMLEKYSFDVFGACFHACYYSHLMHTRKPKPDGFIKIMNEQGIMPGETIFIDNTLENVEAARDLGFRGYWLHDKLVTDLFDENFSPVLELRRC